MAKKDSTAEPVQKVEPQTSKATVLPREATLELVKEYHFQPTDVGLIRFEDEHGVLFGLDNKGMGRFELRMVCE